MSDNQQTDKSMCEIFRNNIEAPEHTRCVFSTISANEEKPNPVEKLTPDEVAARLRGMQYEYDAMKAAKEVVGENQQAHKGMYGLFRMATETYGQPWCANCKKGSQIGSKCEITGMYHMPPH